MDKIKILWKKKTPKLCYTGPPRKKNRRDAPGRHYFYRVQGIFRAIARGHSLTHSGVDTLRN